MGDQPDSVRTATNRSITVVSGEKADYDGTGNHFETDQPFKTTPTKYITLSCTHPNVDIKKFKLHSVRVYMDCTNAVTYQVLLLEAANADDAEHASDIVWKSKTALEDDTPYQFGQTGASPNVASYGLPTIVELEEPNKLYYMIDWSGAPGDTKGTLKVLGVLLK